MIGTFNYYLKLVVFILLHNHQKNKHEQIKINILASYSWEYQTQLQLNKHNTSTQRSKLYVKKCRNFYLLSYFFWSGHSMYNVSHSNSIWIATQTRINRLSVVWYHPMSVTDYLRTLYDPINCSILDFVLSHWSWI